ncbi:MAG: ABC transporter permease, partial [Gemmatimonadetes bacterium]|nr:ABC transporter permease [Gemmatimonadota bacterium]NIT65932.1 ABC transporter permease [Gemmatimonadota bacterium]NIW74368.1 ABC transporter permease [Gemmatimonadota bacterium]NIY34510.1 ABC transporter permease [Gemmatimonadota bacterium]
RARLGLDEPLAVQYLEYLADVAQFDFGVTITDYRPVTRVIFTNGAATLQLAVSGMLIAIVIGVGVGLVAGRFRDTPLDVAGRLYGIVIYATPVFFLGFLAQLILGRELNLLPTSGQASPLVQYTLETHTNILVIDAIIERNWTALADVLRHLAMPAF